jgi:hypothetical protein
VAHSEWLNLVFPTNRKRLNLNNGRKNTCTYF